MKKVNEYNLTIRKEDLEIVTEYTIIGIKFVTTKYGQ